MCRYTPFAENGGPHTIPAQAIRAQGSLRQKLETLPRQRGSDTYFVCSRAPKASEKPMREMGIPMPASSVWKITKMAVLPAFN